MTTGESGPSADDGRPETEEQRADRNWNEILQELRVTQTGTQIISGFLLTIAFQQRFTRLDSIQVGFYLALVFLAAACTLLGLGPVALHRELFRHHGKIETVELANRMLRTTLVLVGLLTCGGVAFIFDVTLGLTAAVVAGVAALVLMVSLLAVFPRRTLTRLPRQPD